MINLCKNLTQNSHFKLGKNERNYIYYTEKKSGDKK